MQRIVLSLTIALCALAAHAADDLKNYPVKLVGKAVKLAFPMTPSDVAMGGTRRTPLTVAVQDKNRRTVREGTFAVTLTLKKFGAAELVGATTVNTINGVATFPDATITGAVADYRLFASANGLRKATSAAFHVGPGSGLLREIWNDEMNFSTSPTRTEILGAALETPVALATNFSSRIRGELIPPLSGQYKFWVAANSLVELWLSTNSATTNQIKLAAVTADTPYRKWPHATEV